MLVKIYTMLAEEVMMALLAADQSSFVEVEDHCDNKKLVVINGEARSAYGTMTVPAAFPEQIVTASILQTSAHTGLSTRSRSTLKVFLKHKSRDLYWVFDFGQVGEKSASSAPFNTTSLVEVLLRCDKVKVEVGEMAEDAFHFPLAWRSYAWHSTWGNLSFENAGAWLWQAVAQAVTASQGVTNVFREMGISPLATKSRELNIWKQVFESTKLAELIRQITGENN